MTEQSVAVDSIIKDVDDFMMKCGREHDWCLSCRIQAECAKAWNKFTEQNIYKCDLKASIKFKAEQLERCSRGNAGSITKRTSRGELDRCRTRRQLKEPA